MEKEVTAAQLVSLACAKIEDADFDQELMSALTTLERDGSHPDEQDCINARIDQVDSDVLDKFHETYAKFAIEREISQIDRRATKSQLEDVYDFNVEVELDIYRMLIGRYPEHVVVIGSGYWPKTALSLQAKQISPICVDIDDRCFNNSVYEPFDCIAGNAATLKFPEADMVLVASTVGPNALTKTRVIENILSQGQKFHLTCSREPIAEERLLFAASKLNPNFESYDIVKRSAAEYCSRRTYKLRA